jgi:hypothetical protein
MSSPTPTLRRRPDLGADAALGRVGEKVTPLDSAEQERLVREFQLDKLRQDTLWKHALAVIYGFSSLLLAIILGCSLLFGCALPPPGVPDTLSGPRCRYFDLPSSLWRATGGSTLLSNLYLLGALVLVLLWASYSYLFGEAAAQSGFNVRQAAAKAPRPARHEQQGSPVDPDSDQALLASAPPLPALPLSPAALARVQLLQRLSYAGALVWLLASVALVVLQQDPRGQLGLLVWLLLGGPLFLAAISALAAKWSTDLDKQIAELDASKYSYHEL